jgi:hypothetical protein
MVLYERFASFFIQVFIALHVPLENSQVPQLNLINSNGKDVRLLQSAPPSASFMTSRLLFLDTDFVALGHNNNAWNVVCPPLRFFFFHSCSTLYRFVRLCRILIGVPLGPF